MREVLHQFYRYTLLLVLGEDLFESQGHIPVIKEGAALEVVLKAPEIDIQRATGDEGVIAYYHLAMIEAGLIEEQLSRQLPPFP